MLLFKFLIVLIAFKNILAGSNRTGGNTVAPKVHTAKFAAGIQLLYPKDEHLCGGVMINLMHVLTAATCVQGFEEGWNLAQLKLKTSDQSQENRASTFFIHDSFNRETGENNLAVIKVDHPFTDDDGAGPVELAAENNTEECFVASWSRKGELSVGKQTPKMVRPSAECTVNVSKTICFGNNKTVTVCDEDYGCPLICDGFLAGIFVGPGDACAGYPGVYVDVRAYKGWLQTTAKYISKGYKKL